MAKPLGKQQVKIVFEAHRAYLGGLPSLAASGSPQVPVKGKLTESVDAVSSVETICN